MLKISLLGTGRIGKMHAELINLNPKTQLEYVYDINKEASEKIAKKYGAKVAKSSEEAISNPNTDVVFIASATPTHINYILSAAKAGKAIFCEKPVDLDIKKVESCREELKKYKVPIHIGFNRRFDPSHKSAKEAKDSGEIGKMELEVIKAPLSGFRIIRSLTGSLPLSFN